PPGKIRLNRIFDRQEAPDRGIQRATRMPRGLVLFYIPEVGLQVFDTCCTLVTFRVEVDPPACDAPLAPVAFPPADEPALDEPAPELLPLPGVGLLPVPAELPLALPPGVEPVTATSFSTTSANFEVSP